MGFMIINGRGHLAYGVKQFVLDELADLKKLPVNIPAGSTAFCIANSSKYMLNTKGEWIKIESSSGGGSGGGSSSDIEEEGSLATPEEVAALFGKKGV